MGEWTSKVRVWWMETVADSGPEKSSETRSAFIKYQPAKSLIILKPPLWGCQPHTSR